MELQHFGIKGMRWGIRRKSTSSGSSSSEPKPKKVGRITAELASAKRERSWKKALGKKASLSDEELNNMANRLKLENSLKRMSSRKEYLNRANISDADLKKRVDRLQLEDNLNRSAALAMADQIKLGAAVVGSVNNVAMSILTGGKKPTTKIVVDAIKGEAKRVAGAAVKAKVSKKTGLDAKVVDAAYASVKTAYKTAKEEAAAEASANATTNPTSSNKETVRPESGPVYSKAETTSDATKEKGRKYVQANFSVVPNKVYAPNDDVTTVANVIRPNEVYEPNDSVTTIIRR